MNRSVIIHRTGNTEVRDVHPALHQQLRGLAYRRFVLKFVRAMDGVTMTSALYAHLPPSPWQVTSAAEQIWGRVRGVTKVFDDEGQELNRAGEVAASAPLVTSLTPPIAHATVPGAPTPTPASTPVTTRGRVLLGPAEAIVLEPKAGAGPVPRIRVRPVPGRGWVIEVAEWTTGSPPLWTEVQVVPEIPLR